MRTTVNEIREVLIPDLSGRHGPLPPLLLVLTVVTGLVDAFSYLVLGRVFVANMTGNIVFLGFALAGASGFSVVASVLALAAFVAGAVAGGRLAHREPRHRGRLLLSVTVVQTALLLAAWVVGLVADLPAAGGVRWALIVLLALAMGAQNAVVRSLAVPDLTTTVLTMTVTGIAADGRAGGGSGSRAGVRVLSALAMFVGALAGAALIVNGNRDVPLLCAAIAAAAVAIALVPLRRARGTWTA
ncbi:YoaK family protein [Streptomyces sp. NPDC058653]|uniref:YoaK family protein n=1 Tax=Streptomyces sp. NPDC058653 TaxID=3346576 RepID=UPI0036593528